MAVFPHDIGMDLLGGVDFMKGCYIGQEVVSRMQHRGTARRRPVVVSGIEPLIDDVEVPPGTAISVGAREAGQIGRVVDGRAVAIVRLDRIKELQPWSHGEYHVILNDGTQLTLSRSYRDKLQSALGNSL